MKKKHNPYFGIAATGPTKSVLKECIGCYYWRATSGLINNGEHCCHFLLDHTDAGNPMKRNGDMKHCKSRLPKKNAEV